MADIDELQIRITSKATDAQKSITLLTGKLKDLATTCKGGCGLQSVINGLSGIRGAVNKIDNNAGTGLISLAEGLKALKGVGKFNLSPDISTTLSLINSTLNTMNADAGTKLQGFAGGLSSLGQVGKISISSTLGRHLLEVAQAGEYFSAHAGGMAAMTSALAALGQVSKVSVSSTTGKHLAEIAQGIERLSTTDVSGLANISVAMSGLAGLKISQATVKNLEGLGKAAETLVGKDFSGLQKLNVELTKMSQSLPLIAQNIQPVKSALGGLDQQTLKNANSTKKLSNSYTELYAAFQLAKRAVTASARTVGQWIDKSNSYIENVNLFTASMGEYADEAKEYAERVGELMGIDPGSWMRNQGVFQTLSTGFGVSADRAAIMSKNLTQLGYDLSSFFNIAVEGEGGAMQKLQAGLAGELEPLRRLGFDLSEARLKAVALSLGIDKTYKSMNQAEKAQLRYYAIMNQVTIAQGDMARTLNSPANQLRILKAQVEQAARALGNVFIPLLNAVLPYLIAAAKAVRVFANALASLFGFKMPEVDYSGISAGASAAEDMSDGLGSSAKNAKKLNELLADWDELNIIASENNSGGSGSGAGVDTGGFDFDLPEYDFLAGLVESNVNQIMETLKPALDWIEQHTQAVLDIITLVGIGFAAWKIDKTLTGGIGSVIKFVLGAALAVWGVKMAYQDFMDQWNNGIDVDNMIALFKDLGLVALGLWFMFGKKGLGIGLLVDGILLAINPIKELIETGQLSEEAFWQLEVAIGAVGAGLSLLTGNWIPLIIAGIIDLGLYIWQHWEDIKAWWDDNVAPLLESIWGFIDSNVIQPIVTGVVDLYETVVVWVESTYNSVSQWVSDLCDAVVTWVSNVYESVVSWVESIYNGVVGWVTDLYTSVVSWVETAYNDVVAWVEETYNGVVGWVTDLYTSVVSWVENAYNDVVAWFVEIYNGIIGAIDGVAEWIDTNVLQPVLYIFESLYLGIVKDIENVGTWWNETVVPWLTVIGEWIDENVIQPVLAVFGTIAQGIETAVASVSEWWTGTVVPWFEAKVTWIDENVVQPVVGFFEGIPSAIETAVAAVATWWTDSVVPWFAEKVAWVDENVVQPVVGFFEGIPDAIIAAIGLVGSWWNDTVIPWVTEKVEWLDTNLIQPIVGFAEGIYNAFFEWLGKVREEGLFTTMISDIQGAFTSLAKWFDENVSTPISNVFVDMVNGIIDAINWVIEKLNSFNFSIGPWNLWDAQTIHLGWPFNTDIGIPAVGIPQVTLGISGIPTLQRMAKKGEFAEGGFPDTGEMFVAREAGPELVGTIGNRTAVANNDQIEAGIAEGVREANSEQNALLQMANQYLRLIASKSNKYTFEPSVGLAQTVKRSEEMRLVAEGV